ncbi:DEAD/DEAH box helicase [Cavenderia fasciculata]|uniref:DEAD/DEAH box helicase n=1 Tax=Cavenderia fasciculata TaxID=261658 RepID=F4PGF0_CACFS|nr:DEAD/DEAH box helicase [Cavenderia fasciculata]EGG24784.1 DEAD/DEAH box helicase [Cavenderia fasciculata]|eukprot:XP_004362635.1 DEAD/DEAH box helicase [Cavenderia fasciculata]
MQIFGRAGRPQFDTFGESFLLTTHDKLHHYLMLMSAAMPIESRFITNLVDHLNAEIVLGTVSNVREAVTWLGYTYLYIRMIANPHVYGIPLNEVGHDPTLEQFRHKLIENAAVQLEKSKMIRFDRASGNFFTTDLGRIASHYYIKHPSIETFNEILKEHMNQEQILTLLTNSSEFENVNLREEETRELTQLSENHLIIPQQSRVINTELLDLRPLPKEALKNPQLEALFKFSHFNPIQTQVFHTLYYTNNNVLLGSPTGSGKTICAELAMFKVFRDEPHMKIVYIAPLKALVRERMNDWSDKLEKKLGKKLVELTGDYTPNVIALQNADVVTTTPEKWDGISRNWKNRSGYCQSYGYDLQADWTSNDEQTNLCIDQDVLATQASVGFLYDPFPVESHLKEFLHDHLNAEIVSGTINNKQQAIEYLTNTFLFRRLLQSPTYYGCEDNSVRSINRFLSELLDNTLDDLQIAKCVSIDENTDDIEPLILGRIASFYYLNFRTVRLFSNNIRADNDIRSLLRILSLAHEYSEFPVRHAEDIINEEFNQRLPIKVEDYLSEHTKVHLLMQAHFERCALPIPDYVTDTKTALDQGIRILQAMIDVAYECGFFATVVQTIRLLQMLVQGRWEQTTDGKDTSLATLPHISLEAADQIAAQLGCKNLKELVLAFNVKPNNNNSKDNKNNKDIVERFKLLIEHQLSMPPTHCRETINVIQHLPIIKISEINQSDALVSRSKPHTVKILVQRENKGFHNNFCHAPQYPKNKDEGWIVVLTDENENFVAFKRLQGLKQHGNQKNNSSLVSFNINIPDNVDANTLVYHVKCYSDSYMGLDYFHTFTVKLEPKKK